MAPYMKASIWQERSMALGFIAGMTAQGMKESGMRIKLEEQELTLGLMEENTRGNGQIITWKELVYTHGLMVEFMKDNTKMIRSMVTAYIYGQIKDSIKECGSEGSSMDLEYILFLAVKESLDYGKMEKEQSGLINKQQKKSNQEDSTILNISLNMKVLNLQKDTKALADLLVLMSN